MCLSLTCDEIQVTLHQQQIFILGDPQTTEMTCKSWGNLWEVEQYAVSNIPLWPSGYPCQAQITRVNKKETEGEQKFWLWFCINLPVSSTSIPLFRPSKVTPWLQSLTHTQFPTAKPIHPVSLTPSLSYTLSIWVSPSFLRLNPSPSPHLP